MIEISGSGEGESKQSEDSLIPSGDRARALDLHLGTFLKEGESRGAGFRIGSDSHGPENQRIRIEVEVDS